MNSICNGCGYWRCTGQCDVGLDYGLVPKEDMFSQEDVEEYELACEKEYAEAIRSGKERVRLYCEKHGFDIGRRVT